MLIEVGRVSFVAKWKWEFVLWLESMEVFPQIKCWMVYIVLECAFYPNLKFVISVLEFPAALFSDMSTAPNSFNSLSHIQLPFSDPLSTHQLCNQLDLQLLKTVYSSCFEGQPLCFDNAAPKLAIRSEEKTRLMVYHKIHRKMKQFLSFFFLHLSFQNLYLNLYCLFFLAVFVKHNYSPCLNLTSYLLKFLLIKFSFYYEIKDHNRSITFSFG